MSKLHWIQNKIYTEPPIKLCNVWRNTSKKIVFTNGCFDILHRGHIDLLLQAANLGDVLIVGLNSDASIKRLKGNERPINNEYDRAFQLASLLCVDAVCLFTEDTPEKLIVTLRPDILAKGGDYVSHKIIGGDFVKSIGGSVEIIPFVDGYSTTSIIKKIRS